MSADAASLRRVVLDAAVPWHEPASSADHEALPDTVGDAAVVLLGEASHGTHEFYAERAAITRRLIEERGFQAVAVEADWPDASRVNPYRRRDAGVRVRHRRRQGRALRGPGRRAASGAAGARRGARRPRRPRPRHGGIDWDAPAERKRVRPALAGSWKAALHGTGMQRLLLPLGAGSFGDDATPRWHSGEAPET